MKQIVAFVSQVGNETREKGRNDCGAACISMIVGRTVDQVLTDIAQPGNEPLHMQTIMRALRKYGVANEHVRPLSLPKLRETLVTGWPVIALVNYARLPRSHKADPNYNDNHFVVVVGYTADGYFFVHDPLWPTAAQGAYRRWPEAVIGEALAFVARGVIPMQGIAIHKAFEIVEADMGELGLAVSAALGAGAAAHYLEQLLSAMEVEPGPLAERVGHALARITVWQAAGR